jgi:hypothetical protein
MRSLSILVRREITFPAIMAGLAVFFTILGCSDSPCVSPCTGPGCFEVHEWGVMVGCRADTAFFLTSRPETVLAVRIPVIYFHSPHKRPFTARVEFKTGKPTDTYPEATVSAASAIWENVQFSRSTKEPWLQGSDDFLPLEDIIETLNDVDADLLEYHGTEARFLFYEGEAEFQNRVLVSYDFDAQEATFDNQSDYTVHNVMLSAAVDRGPGMVYFASVDSLDPGETITLDLMPPEFPYLGDDLVGLGFTEEEGRSFTILWDDTFFMPSTWGEWANLIYRLPQAEYDRLISLEIDPEPEKVIRALYVLVHLED